MDYLNLNKFFAQQVNYVLERTNITFYQDKWRFWTSGINLQTYRYLFND